MAGERWLFSRSQLMNTPSRKCGIDSDKELYYRQQAANFVQDMGQRLQVTQLCINTSIVYLHRFYMFHSFTKFSRNNMAQACLFLAAKLEEQPRKLEHVIKVAHMILHREQGPPTLDTKSVAYLEQAQELVANENILLQTLGFEVTVDHPHSHIVKTCNLIRASKDLAQTSYFLATNSLHLTTMCLSARPTMVACVCIHLACKWAQFEIPRSSEGEEWFTYVDPDITAELLEELTSDFLAILDKCPSKFKKKLMSKTGKDEEIPGLILSSVPERKPPEKKPHSEPTATVTSGSAAAHTAAQHPKPAWSDVVRQGLKEKTASIAAASHSHKDTKPQTGPSMASPFAAPGVQTGGHATAGSSQPSHAPPATARQPPHGQAPAATDTIRRSKTESFLTSLTPKEYLERRERERHERERIEKERQLLLEKEKEKAAAAHRAEAQRAESRASHPEHRPPNGVPSRGEKPHHAVPTAHKERQHPNIFDQLQGEKPHRPSQVEGEKVKSSRERDRHSLERSHAEQSYKDKYHERAGKEKLAGEPPTKRDRVPKERPMLDVHKEREWDRSSQDLHKARSSLGVHKIEQHGQHKPDVKLETDSGRSKHLRHEHHHVERDYRSEHKSHGSSKPPQGGATAAFPESQINFIPEGDPGERAVQTEASGRPENEKKVQENEYDAEEGEIVDDDSPQPEEELKHKHARSHHHRHHRERRSGSHHRHRHHASGSSSGRHSSSEQEILSDGRGKHKSPIVAPLEGSSRHKSPRSKVQKEESLTLSSPEPKFSIKQDYTECAITEELESVGSQGDTKSRPSLEKLSMTPTRNRSISVGEEILSSPEMQPVVKLKRMNSSGGETVSPVKKEPGTPIRKEPGIPEFREQGTPKKSEQPGREGIKIKLDLKGSITPTKQEAGVLSAATAIHASPKKKKVPTATLR